MFKSKRTKIFSVGLALLLFGSCLAVSATAETDNLFPNPEFAYEDNALLGGWGLVNDGAISNLVSVKEAGEDAPSNVSGNLFKALTGSQGIKSSFMDLNSDSSCYITVWYKVAVDELAQVVVEEFTDDSDSRIEPGSVEGVTTVKGATTLNCTSSGNGWSLYKIYFSAKNPTVATRVRVTFRRQALNGIDDAAYFMAPTYSKVVPEQEYFTYADFEEAGIGTLAGWTHLDTTAGSIEVAKENIEGKTNKYLSVYTSGTARNRLRKRASEGLMLTHGLTYKVSFKIKASALPTIDIIALNENNYQVGSKLNTYSMLLGELSDTKWVEYVCYCKLDGETKDNPDAKRNGPAVNIQIDLRGVSNSTIGYDDFKIEPAESNIMLYQNGTEITTFTNGTIKAQYHNESKTDSATMIVAFYKIVGTQKQLDKIIFEEIPANTEADLINPNKDTVASYEIGDDISEVKVFGWRRIGGLEPTADLKVATRTAE